MTPGRGTLWNVQALRAVAALLILVHHAWIIEAKYGGGGAVMPDWAGMSRGVDLFFVISGFIVVTATRHVVPGLRTAGEFLYRRLTRIYPLYWFYTLLILPVYLVRPDLVNSLQDNQADVVASFLLLPQALLPLLPVGWTLEHTVYFYLAFTLFLVVPMVRLEVGLAVWAAIVLAAMALALDPGSAVLALVLDPLTLEFILGAGLGLLVARGHLPAPRLLLVLGIVAWIGFYAIHRASGGVVVPAESLQRVVLFGLPSVLVLWGAVGMEVRQQRTAPAWLRTIGDWSYSLFLSHLLVLVVIGRAWAAFATPGPLDSLVMLPVMIGAAIAWSALSYRWLEVPMLRRTAALNPFRERLPATA